MAAKLDKFKDLLSNHQKIGLDTMCFIYQFSDHPRYAPITNPVFESLEAEETDGVTSMITVLEVFVKPETEGDQVTISEYERILQQFPNLSILPIDWPAARLASKIRAKYNSIQTPDALQVATALIENCTLFITNDAQLKQVDEIEIFILDEFQDLRGG